MKADSSFLRFSVGIILLLMVANDMWAGGDDVLSAWLQEVNLVTLNDKNEVTGISLAGERSSEQDVERLKEFPELVSVTVISESLSQRAYETLADLPKLKSLTIEDPQLADASLAPLAGANRLVSLRISDAKFVNLPEPKLVKMTNLSDLGLDFCELDERFVQSLSALTKLERLSLYGAKGVTDESLKCIVTMKELRALDLHKSGIDGTCFDSIVKCEKLESLKCSDTDIDDDDLEKLHSLKNLEFLSVLSTRVTKEGVDRFKLACPWVKKVLFLPDPERLP